MRINCSKAYQMVVAVELKCLVCVYAKVEKQIPVQQMQTCIRRMCSSTSATDYSKNPYSILMIAINFRLL